MLFKLIIEENGEYLNAQNQNCTLISAVNYIDTPEGRNVGCVELPAITDAEIYFNIQKIESEQTN